MLRRVLRSRTFHDIVDVLAALFLTSLALFAAGTVFAHWLSGPWPADAEVGVVLVLLFLGFAVPISAAFGVPRLARILRGARGR